MIGWLPPERPTRQNPRRRILSHAIIRKAALSVFLALTAMAAGCVPHIPASVPVTQPDYWPTAEWRSSSPEAQGMDSSLLASMLEELSNDRIRMRSLLVIRNGYLVTQAYFDPYRPDTKVQIQSVTKSVIGALVGTAIQQGYIQSVDEKMLSFFPDRVYANPSRKKDAIRLRHLLSMSSGFPCQEFSDGGQRMELSSGWVQFMLDLPVDASPGKTFGYCDGNPHLLSAIIERTTGLTARDFGNRELFEPLGIAAVESADWWTDPQGISNGGYGLWLRPLDLAKLAFLYLHDGRWDGQQILPQGWAAASTTQYVQKLEGSGYGFLWTVYPDAAHYAALGLAGQQVHVYPSHNLIVVTTAELESYAEAPEIERMLTDYILPAVKSDAPLPENPDALARLQAAVETAANPAQPVPVLPALARRISGETYILSENPYGWGSVTLEFGEGSSVARVSTDAGATSDEIGLDNLFRAGKSQPAQFMRGRWIDGNTYSIDWTSLGSIGSLAIDLRFSASNVEVTVRPVVFGGAPTVIHGER
jgi:CubicO group peptidase (beta-lactamase class C family)